MANPDGRPPKVVFTKKKLEEIEEMAACGLYTHQIAACLGYSVGHFVQVRKDQPEVAEAIKRGTAMGILDAAKSIRNEVKKRNMTATIFYLKCKAGWRDNAGSDDDGAERDTESVGRRVLDDVRKVRARRG